MQGLTPTSHDVRGNQTHRYVGSSLTRRVDYTIFDKPHTIWSNQGESRFSYDAAQKLVKRIDKKAGGDTVTYYVGGHEVIYEPNGSSATKRYIRDIAIHTLNSNGSQSLHYVFNDHLGSGSVITDASGNVVETASFDAFGKRRNAKTWQGFSNPFTQLPNLQALLTITQKGFTGHIQVDHAAVIHMGGRIYDPELGRFMQADPIVQDPRDAQSLNRYSYVYNNPLSYTDPTGYSPDCGAKGGEDCPTTVDQEKKEAAAIAAQTNGDSASAEVGSNNSSADLQNSAKGANGAKDDARELRKLERRAQRGGRDLDKYRNAQDGSAAGAIALAGRAVSTGGRVAVPAWLTNPLGLIVLALTPTKMGDGTVAGAGIDINTATPEIPVWRVHGGAAAQDGRYWSPVDPRTVVNYRDAAGLPNSNTGEFLTQGLLIDLTGVRAQPAAPLDGNAGRGIIEYFVPNPSVQIRMGEPQRLNPPL